LLGGLALRRPLLRRLLRGLSLLRRLLCCLPLGRFLRFALRGLLRRFLLRGLLLPSLLLRSLLGLLGRFLLGGLLLRRFLRRCRGGGRHHRHHVSHFVSPVWVAVTVMLLLLRASGFASVEIYRNHLTNAPPPAA